MPKLSLRSKLLNWTGFRNPEDQVSIVLSIIIGVVVGLTVVAFILLTGRLATRMYPPGGARASVQGLVSCAKCGYAFSRTSTQTSARKIHYYKCIGSDSWRKLGAQFVTMAASSDKSSWIRSCGLR